MRLTPLLVGILLSCPLAALAAEAPKNDAQKGVVPYPEVFDKTAKEAAEKFLNGLPLPEMPAPRTEEEQKLYGRQFENFETLTAQAGYIQAGRGPQDDVDTWNAMVTQVALKLDVDVNKALETYGAVQRPGTGENGEGDTAEAALRAGLIAEILNNPKVPKASHKDLAARMERARTRLLSDLMDDGSSAEGASRRADIIITRRTTYGDARDIQNIPPQVRPLVFKPSEPPQAGASGWSGKILSFLDTKRAGELANAVAESASGFKGKCYAYVKAGLKKILPTSWFGWLYEDQGSAYKFTENLRENPKMLDKLKLRKLTAADIPDGVPPVGSIVVYGRGVCGFHPVHGHIEVRVAGEPPRYCSDGCTQGRTSLARRNCIQQNLGVKDRVNVYVPVKDEALAQK